MASDPRALTSRAPTAEDLIAAGKQAAMMQKYGISPRNMGQPGNMLAVPAGNSMAGAMPAQQQVPNAMAGPVPAQQMAPNVMQQPGAPVANALNPSFQAPQQAQMQTQAPVPIRDPQSIATSPEEAGQPRKIPRVPDDYEPGPAQKAQLKAMLSRLSAGKGDPVSNNLAAEGPDAAFYKALAEFQQHFGGAR